MIKHISISEVRIQKATVEIFKQTQKDWTILLHAFCGRGYKILKEVTRRCRELYKIESLNKMPNSSEQVIIAARIIEMLTEELNKKSIEEIQIAIEERMQKVKKV